MRLNKRSVLAVSVLLMAVLLVSGAGYAQDSEQELVRKMRVNYRAQQKFDPEVAVIDLGVETRNQNLNLAYTNNSRATQRVKSKLEKMDGLRIISTNYRVRLENPHYKDKSPAEYVVSNRIKIETVNLDKLGKVIQQAIQAGANRITAVNYKLADYEQARKKVTSQALQGLKEKASFVAQEMGVELINIIQLDINDQNNHYVHRSYSLGDSQMKAAVESAAQPVISPEKIEIEVDVRGVYQIK